MTARVVIMVRLTRIYTRTGDGGQTQLVRSVTGQQDRSAGRGVRRCGRGQLSDRGRACCRRVARRGCRDALRIVQNELFDLGADLSNPLRVPGPADPPPELRITQDYIDRLEAGAINSAIRYRTLKSFILPGGSLPAAQLHVARTVVRRAERAAWAAATHTAPSRWPMPKPRAGSIPLAITYLNRLSDLLFILTRVVNGPDGDVLWVPGGDRTRVQHK